MKHEGTLCTVCKKGKLIRLKEDRMFGETILIDQPVYICDTCDMAFQTGSDYRYAKYLVSVIKGNMEKGDKICMDTVFQEQMT